MPEAYLIASHHTAFARHPTLDHAALAAAAWHGLAEATSLGPLVDRIYFGSCAMHLYGQANIRGQVALGALQRGGKLSGTAPIVNIEGACATGGLAFQSAVEAVRGGGAELALAIGVEKTFHPEPQKILELFSGGIDQLHPEAWRAFYEAAAAEMGGTFAPHPHRIIFLDVAALQAHWHQRTYGSTDAQLAMIASKNHAHGARNDKAQYRQEMSVEQILADKPALLPLRRSMCAPISDGAAAVLVCGEAAIGRVSNSVQKRAVRVASVASAGGRWRALAEESVSARAARTALRVAGRSIGEMSLIELHDATAFAELHAYEDLGLCAKGAGGTLAESGETKLGGRFPINVSGGLESKGHPLAATGLAMITELHTQLLGEAGARQVEGATRGLFHNAGGQIGFDEALAVVGVLERS